MTSENDSTFRKLIAAAKRAGWRVKRTGTEHWALWPPNKEDPPVYVSGTPSGTRWLRAVRGKLRRLGVEV